MPWSNRTPCHEPLCGALVDRGETFCADHKRTAPTSWQAYTGGRSAHARGYGRRWRALRLQVLLEESVCRLCKAEGFIESATEVDHILPKRHGGIDDRSNLQAVCGRCHRAKTAREHQSTPMRSR